MTGLMASVSSARHQFPRFLFNHAAIYNTFNTQLRLLLQLFKADAMDAWRVATAA